MYPPMSEVETGLRRDERRREATLARRDTLHRTSCRGRGPREALGFALVSAGLRLVTTDPRR